jgi:hypothetical protein
MNSIVKLNTLENLTKDSIPLNIDYSIESGILSSRDKEMDGIYGVLIFSNKYILHKKYYIRERSSHKDYYIKNLSESIDTSVLYPLLDSIYLKNHSGIYGCPNNIKYSNSYSSNYYKINYNRNGQTREINLVLENCFLSKEIDLLDSMLNVELKKAEVEEVIKTQESINKKCKCIEYKETKSFYK